MGKTPKLRDGGDVRCRKKTENGQFRAEGTEAAVTPTRWCVDRLDPSIQVVSPEELLWRIRLRDRQEQTRAIIEGLP